MPDPPDPLEILERRLAREAERRGMDPEACRTAVLERGLEGFAEDRERRSRHEALRADVLLITATAAEHRTTRQVLREWGIEPVKVQGDYFPYLVLEGLGDWRVRWLQVEMGASGQGGSTARCLVARHETLARTFILLGVAFGNPPVQLGDVLISDEVCLYDEVEVGQDAGNVIVRCRSRGSVFNASRFWANQMSERGRRALTSEVGVHRGLLLSGGALVASALFRDTLVERARATGGSFALGGEMEAAGVIAAAAERDWVVVKGVCDLADGASRVAGDLDMKREKAARNAAGVVLTTLRETPRGVQEP